MKPDWDEISRLSAEARETPELDALRRQIEHDLRYKMQLIGKVKDTHKERITLRARVKELEEEVAELKLAHQEAAKAYAIRAEHDRIFAPFLKEGD